MTVQTRSRTMTATLVVAAAGYGKSTWVEAHAPADVLEGLHQWPAVEQAERLTRLADERLAADSDRPLVITSRLPLEAKVRSVLSGPVQERGPIDLALSPQTVAAVLDEEYGLTDPELPTLVHGWTAGWPTLVHLCADAATTAGAIDGLWGRLTSPASTVAAWLENDVLADLPASYADLLTMLAPLELLHPELAAVVVGVDPGDTWVQDAYAWLESVGVLVPDPHARLVGRAGHQIVPLLAAVLRGSGPGLPADQWVSSAQWYADRDAPYYAALAHARAGDQDAALALIAAEGGQMIAHGHARGLVALIQDLGPVPDLPDQARLVLAGALAAAGDSFAALGAFAPLTTAADESSWDPGLAVRVASVHFSQGDLLHTREVLERVSSDQLPVTGDGIGWRAARVIVASMLGEDELAMGLAAETLRLAEASTDPADLVAAHQAVAKISTGSRKSAHLELALTAARRAGDAASLARILGNQAYTLLAAVRCAEAVAVGREAVRAAELVRPMGALIASLHNLAEGLTRTGEYAEARWHLRRAGAVSRRLGAHRAATSLYGLGEIHRALGEREQGRAAYEESVGLARTSGELQVLVPALGGLARLLVDETPTQARAAAEEALALAPAGLAPYAMIALGHVELAAGDRQRASELAEAAGGGAREQQALDLIADALELGAIVETDHGRAAAALHEALSIWQTGGAGPECDRIEVLLGRLDGADREAQRRGRDAAERLQRLGVTRIGGRSVSEDPVGKAVKIQVLGRFEAAVAGQSVSLKTWKSRQARTLVKVLAARHGRPASRGELCEVLWPDADPAKTSHRLSVLLTTVRGVLDPGKAWPPDRHIATDARGVWLDLRRVSIDAVELMAEAEHGASLVADGRADEAIAALSAVDRLYLGEAFEDEPYEDWVAAAWAVALKEQTRAAWLRSLRHLATIATQQGRSNDASALLARLLDVDPYDERVHRGLVRTLVRAGRHGEARRAFNRWSDAMTTVDAPPPDRAELVPRPRNPD